MKRIILHWSGGANKANATDKKHYHFIVEGDGTVVNGHLPPEANENIKTPYAAHTRNLNTGSIGVSLAGMHGAKERPFNAGKRPITEKQVDAAMKLTARLCAKYGISVTRDRVLTHAEVQPTLGVKQRFKWDITWLPKMDQPRDPVLVGDILRKRIKAEMPRTKTTPQSNIPALFAALFGRFNK